MSDNRKIQLPPIDITAVPMFMHAFRLASATALFGGGRYEESGKLFKQYAEILEAVAPPVYKMFRSEEVLYELGLKVATCSRWSVYIKEVYPSSFRYETWEPHGWICLQIDDYVIQHERWVSHPKYKPSSPEYIELEKFIEMIAPLDAEHWQFDYTPKEEAE